MALYRRPPAHGQQALRPLHEPRARAAGDRHRTGAERRERVGYEFADSIVDDHTRLAYSELHPDERGPTVAAFTARALEFFASLGIRPRRLITDNAFVYTKSAELRALLAEHGIRHLTTQPRRPQTNGKSSASSRRWRGSGPTGSATVRQPIAREALPHWLRCYNEQRPHSGIEDRPPISRVHDVSDQDI